MKKIILITLTIFLGSIISKAQDMNAFGISFLQQGDDFREEILGTYLDITFAYDITESNEDGMIDRVVGMKELVSKKDAYLIFMDTAYSLSMLESDVTEMQTLSTFHYKYIIGNGCGYVDLVVRRKLVIITFERKKIGN